MAWIEPYRTKRGKRYLVCERRGGKTISKSAGASHSTAVEIRNKWEGQAAKIGAGVLQETRTIAECVEDYTAAAKKTKSPRTVAILEASLRYLTKDHADKMVAELGKTDLEKLKTKLLATNKVNGINIIIRNIKTFFEFCRELGYIGENPAKGVRQYKKQKVARFLARQEIASVLRNSSRKLRRSLIVLLYTGVRLGEYLDIKEADFDGKGLIVNGKTGPRTIPIHRKCRRYLYVRWNRDAIEEAFRRAVKKAKIGRVRLHDFRHTFCSSYLKSGGTLADLKEITGHQTIKVLAETYAHFQKSYLEDRIELMKI